MKKLFVLFMLCSFAVFADPININQADADTISKALTGIGPKKAEAVVQYRKEHGDFKSLKDLENVPGIGEKTIQQNEKNILLGDPAPATAVKTDKPEKPEKPQEAKKSK
ncbi:MULTISPECIES: ComEA family DNA-binding protein [Methylomonas]|uniref:Competence protein ComEA n=2 Tax=Methylomonas TaxID=416 RepID=A0A126T5H1_9GAMM|nr:MULTISPECIES: helix-hairpin-helix domain-containing protein [Methylomonas]AMK77318.1 competence protein ComEA [Methylomonas denitrificans]OAH97817.1 competence protein ComEA [Methylomonas methanica]TCV77542.1 competence protein ComEA [Methylomonas methanica]